MMLRLEVRLIVANAWHKMHTYTIAIMHSCAAHFNIIQYGVGIKTTIGARIHCRVHVYT